MHLKIYLLFFLLCSSVLSLPGQTVYYSIADGDFFLGSTWSTSPGGSPAALPPGPNDYAVIDHNIFKNVVPYYTYFGDILIKENGTLNISSGDGITDPYVFAGDYFEVQGTLITSSDFDHQRAYTDDNGILIVGKKANLFIGDDLRLGGHGQTILDNAACGDGFAIDDLYFVGTNTQICGNGRFVVPDEIRSWLDDGTEIYGTTRSAQIASQMCAGFTLYGSQQNCADEIPEITGTGPFTFPVEYESLSAAPGKTGVMVTWVTSQERNNDYFSLERSMDGSSFSEIQVIDGLGNSNVSNTYQFLDKAPLSGKVYYRLRQTDFNGGFEYSPIIEAFVEVGQVALSIAPNPIVDGAIQLSLPGLANAKTVNIQLLDMQGKLLQQTNHTFEKSTDLRLDWGSSLKPGIYFLKIETGSALLTERVMVR
ncbi:MAG: T9SS type A sorting domain-containing protein [Bacteroidota bacterium]